MDVVRKIENNKTDGRDKPVKEVSHDVITYRTCHKNQGTKLGRFFSLHYKKRHYRGGSFHVKTIGIGTLIYHE
jgi:hypothetical protein